MNGTAIPELAAAVLAGGRSRRMGRDKALMEWRGERLLDRQLRLLKALGPAHLFLSTRLGVSYDGLDVPLVFDREEDRGPLGALDALFARSRASHFLIVAVDMPQLTFDVLQVLLARCTPHTGVVPQQGDEFEPLAAVYPRACAARLPALLRHGRGAMHDLIQPALAAGELAAWTVPNDWSSAFANWNKPDDLSADARLKE